MVMYAMTKTLMRREGTCAILFLGLAFFSLSAFAQIDNQDLLDSVLARYATATSAWGVTVTRHATRLFWVLATISMTWTFGMMALRKADMGEFFAEFVRFTIFTGFFWWLLTNGPVFAVSIMDSLRQVGAEASGLDGKLGPSRIVDIGFDIFFKVVERSSIWTLADSICGILISVAILIVFCLIGVNMLLLLVSGWMLAYAGIFFLGFGGARWTSEMAIGYFRTVLNIAAQLFAMVLIVGIGKSFVDQYYASMSAGLSMKELGVMIAVAAIMLMLVNKIPPLIGSLAGGNAAAVGNGFGLGAAMSAAALAASAASLAGTAVAAGATGAAGGVQAMMSAFSKARDEDGKGDAGTADNNPDAGSSSGSGNVEGDSLSAAMGDSDAGHSGTPDARESQTGSSANTADSTENAGRQNGNSGQAQASASSGAQVGGSAKASHTSSGKSSADTTGTGTSSEKMRKVVAGAAKNLAQGAREVAQGHMAGAKDKLVGRLSETMGGKIAGAIRSRQIKDISASAPPNFSDDAIAAGNEPVDAEAEIAAFRDRTDTDTNTDQ